ILAQHFARSMLGFSGNRGLGRFCETLRIQGQGLPYKLLAVPAYTLCLPTQSNLALGKSLHHGVPFFLWCPPKKLLSINCAGENQLLRRPMPLQELTVVQPIDSGSSPIRGGVVEPESFLIVPGRIGGVPRTVEHICQMHQRQALEIP